MKILAIRGENLASLDGPFEIDLENGIIGQVGLFAITGPTGAGKSTLLDAICVCLYDKTPRLADRAGNPVRLEGVVDETALKANDQRNILRHGTGHGYAEVDFTGRDGSAYSARWEVRRARRSPTGRVQAQEWTLRARGAPVGHVIASGKKSEVEAAIRHRVGLDFEQFRRSVLLAQGDFAAFLKASEHERALLLEQMTGSEIYTRLSRAAFRKKQTLKQTRETLEVQLGEHPVMSSVDRATAEAELIAADDRRQRAGAAEKMAEAAVSWHTEDKRLTALLVEAETARARAQSAVNAAAPRRNRFDSWHKAWPLRALATENKTHQEHAKRAHTALQQANTSEQTATARRQATASHATATLAEAAGAWEALAEQLENRLERARTGRLRLQAWLADHSLLVRLVESEELVRLVGEGSRPGTFDKRVELVGRRQHIQTTVRTQRLTQLAKAREALTEATTARTEADTRLTEASAKAAAARAELARVSTRLPAARATAITERRHAHTTLTTVAQRAQDAVRQSKIATAQAATKRAEAERATVDAAASNTAATALAEQLKGAEQSLQRSRAVVSVDGLRQALQAEEPCSVCGSTTHPWADGSPLSAVLGELEKQVAELRQALDLTRRKQAEATTRHQAALDATQVAVAQLSDADDRLASLSTEWATACAALPEPTPLHDQRLTDAEGLTELSTHLDALGHAVEADELQLKADQNEERRLRTALDSKLGAERAALAARDAAVSRSETTAQVVPGLEQAVVAVDRDVKELNHRIDTMEGELNHTLTPLASQLPADSPLTTWRSHLGTPAPVITALRDARDAVRKRRERLSEAEVVVETLGADAPVARSRAEQAAQTLPDDTPPHIPVTPPGLPAEQTLWLRSRAAAADQSVTTARQAADSADAQARRAREHTAAAKAAHQTHQTAADAAQARLAAESLQHSLDTDALDALCALPSTWPDTERAALDAFDTAVQLAKVREQERQQVCRVHLDKRPDADAPTADTRLSAAQTERSDAVEAWGACRARIDGDDKARSATARLQATLEAHDGLAEPWIKLADCIGSANGKEFRKYAQSLTLELLLAQANAHLRRLHPRYRLARIAGTDLDILVIDGDLGDEARTVRGLSGGEGFLVSLALALGLSSLSARDVRVESLFIDEGFGTLDASSLDKALSVLDSLQSEGRQVGIISHVGGLAERIGVRVAVEPQGGGRSTVRVLG